MGKKYIVEIGRLERLYKAFIGAHGKPEITWLSPEVDLTPYTEPDMEQVRKEAYEQGRKYGKIEGQAETWVCVKKIAFKPEIAECVDDLVRIGFDVGTADSWSEAIELLFEKYSASEAIEKIRQYEQEKEELQVGDEYCYAGTNRCVITEITDNFYRILWDCGTSGVIDELTDMESTGRHFPEIAEVLRKMKETSNG